MHEPERQWVTSRFRVVKADCPVVVIHTDEGLTGIGEACAYGVPRFIQSGSTGCAQELVGKDPTDPGPSPIPTGATMPMTVPSRGIDCALWDLKGQIEGKRVAELLTAAPLDKVRLYASSGCRYDWRIRPEQLIDEALELHRPGASPP